MGRTRNWLAIGSAAAFITSGASCPDSIQPMRGDWTARVLLVTPTGVPTTDSAATTTVMLSLQQSGEVLTGTVTGLFSGMADVTGSMTGSTVEMTFDKPG